MLVFGGACALTAGLVPICRAFTSANDNDPATFDPAALLAKADILWSSGDPKDRMEAINHYKLFLKSTTKGKIYSAYMESHLSERNRLGFRQLSECEKELPKVYRRVIEYEADYGDPGEAVDWIRLGLDEDVKLFLNSEKANQLLEKVQRGKSR